MDEEEQLRVQNELRAMLVEVRRSSLEEAAGLVEMFAAEFLLQPGDKSLSTAMSSLFSAVAGEIKNLQGDSDG